MLPHLTEVISGFHDFFSESSGELWASSVPLTWGGVAQTLSLSWNWSQDVLCSWTQLSPSLSLILFSMASFLKLLTGVGSLACRLHLLLLNWPKQHWQMPLEPAAPITPLCFIFHYFGVYIIWCCSVLPNCKLPAGNGSGVEPVQANLKIIGIKSTNLMLKGDFCRLYA